MPEHYPPEADDETFQKNHQAIYELGYSGAPLPAELANEDGLSEQQILYREAYEYGSYMAKPMDMKIPKKALWPVLGLAALAVTAKIATCNDQPGTYPTYNQASDTPRDTTIPANTARLDGTVIDSTGKQK